MLYVIITGFLAAMVAPAVHKLQPRLSGPLLSLVPLGIFGYLLTLLGSHTTFTYQWFPALGVDLHFIADGLSLIFALIISGIGAIIVFYASEYLREDSRLPRFYGYLFFFMTAMIGVVLSDNLLVMFVFWELTSISSYLLIGFNHDKERSRYAALQALLVTGGGGLAMLAGFLMLGKMGGTYSISALMQQSEHIVSHGLYVPMVILILLGAFTKSAQWPFHFWLPNAMEAPTPVSAYLHSATMVKAGVFLIARITPVLAGPDLWHTLLISLGGITMLMGASMAIGQNDLKRILAYTTVSALGIMVFLLGMGGKYAITAAMTFLLVHSLYKGGLFLVAGAIDHETGTRDVRMLGGLRRYMPFITAGAILAAFSYSGIPPFLGFIAKELIYEGAVEYPVNPILLTIMVVLTNMFLVATAIMVGIRPFFGKTLPTPRMPHTAPFRLWSGPLLLGILGLILGVIPIFACQTLIAPCAMVVTGEFARLSLWHGFNIILLLSLITLSGGIAIYFLAPVIKKKQPLFDIIAKGGPEQGYRALLNGLIAYAPMQTRFFQTGKLRNYFYYILVFFTGILIITMVKYDIYGWIRVDLSQVFFHEFLIVGIMLLAAFKATVSRSVLGAVAALGIVGFGVALLFAFLSAPDLALTQFSIETLTVILLVLVAYKVPGFKTFTPRKNKIKDVVISLLSGAVVSLIMLIVLNNPSQTRISDYFLENSYLLAHGRNVVNVILVDFRALDTMGEVVVLSLAAIGVYTLLKFRRRTIAEK